MTSFEVTPLPCGRPSGAGDCDIAGLTAGDVMSAPAVTVGAHESLLSAWELLRRGGFRHLPVVGPDGRCVGLVDERTVVVELAQVALQRRQVADVMPRRVHCALAETSIADVARIVVNERVTAVPVVDMRNRLLGIVTDSDLVAVLTRASRASAPGSLEGDLPDHRRAAPR